MKIWNSYGAEHSSNLVMIGTFKQASDAEEVKELIDSLFDNLRNLIDLDFNKDRYDDEVRNFLTSKNVYNLSPQDLCQFLFDISVDLQGNEIRVTTDEEDVSGIQKLMIHNGARVEVFSAHDYPESNNSK